MNKVVDATLNVLTKVGDTIERHLVKDDKKNDDGYYYIERAGSDLMFSGSSSASHRPLDKKKQKFKVYSAKERDLIYGGARKYSSDNLAASPGYSSFSNYRQNPGARARVDGVDRPPYGTGIGGPLNYGLNPNANYGAYSNPYSNGSSSAPYSSLPGNVAYAPDYYIAERRQVELVPAPPPRIIQQPYAVPVPVDRPVPRPYPVEVIRHVPVDRPVPVPYPTPVPVDRPVAVPVPVPVPSPPPPPVCVPVPVPTAVPYYVPIGVPVPSPPPSPVIFEQSVTHTQRWINGTPAPANQQQYVVQSPAPMMNSYAPYGNGSFVR